MDIKSQIEADFLVAIKSKDMATLSILRLLKNAIKNQEIDSGEITDEQIISLIRKQAKQLEESIAIYAKTNRLEARDKETAELEIVKKYLPPEISDDILEQKVNKAITKTGAQSIKDMGKVMSALMPELKGQVDGSRLSRKVTEKLSS